MSIQEYSPLDIKLMPESKADRDAIRQAAIMLASDIDTSRPPEWNILQSRALAALDQLNFPHIFLGYAMVCVSNAFWRKQFEAIPFSRRLLLLPHCLSNKNVCTAHYDSIGLHCEQCGSCNIGDLKTHAEKLGYHVITAEGTSAVIMNILEGNTDAVLGVACLDSLEKSYSQIVEFGIPQIAIPLVRDGCTDTEAEIDEIISALHSQADPQPLQLTRSYLPLFRETARIFDESSLSDLVSPYVSITNDTIADTQSIAMDWLKIGGKRLRPFITTSAYAVSKHGLDVLKPDADTASLIPASVKRIALAIELLHKASLVHDDIEDDDELRYGRQTIHRQYGIAPAINTGDYLVGLGYKLIAGAAQELGADCTMDIINNITTAHLDLCRGQGAELLWNTKHGSSLKPIDALSIYALKTAPAFEAALYAGLRAAGLNIDTDLLTRFCTYIGEGYQVLNDLDEWQSDGGNHSAPGKHALGERPAILRAFAIEAGGGDRLTHLLNNGNLIETADAVRNLYIELGVFDRAWKLLDKLRSRAHELADNTDSDTLRELMVFLAGVVLPHRSAASVKS